MFFIDLPEVEHNSIIHLEVVLGYKNTPDLVENDASVTVRVVRNLHNISHTHAKAKNTFCVQVQWLS